MNITAMRKLWNLILSAVVMMGLIAIVTIFINTTTSANGSDTFILLADSGGTASQNSRSAVPKEDGTASQNNLRRNKKLLNI